MNQEQVQLIKLSELTQESSIQPNLILFIDINKSIPNGIIKIMVDSNYNI